MPCTSRSSCRPAAADEVVGAFLARSPSTRRFDPEGISRAHERLAVVEGEDGPLLPWYPDNSILVAPHDRRDKDVGSAQMADLLAGFHTVATDLAFPAIEETHGATRLALCFDLMIATAHVPKA
jgi:Lantibiotic biosynthesis dehydratase C-term